MLAKKTEIHRDLVWLAIRAHCRKPLLILPIAAVLLLVLPGCSGAKGIAHEQAAVKEVEKQSTPESPQTLDELNELRDTKIEAAEDEHEQQKALCHELYDEGGVAPSNTDMMQCLADVAEDLEKTMKRISRWYELEKLSIESRQQQNSPASS